VVVKAGLDRNYKRYRRLFKKKTRDNSHRALQYLQGLIQSDKAVNMTNIPKTIPGSDNQSLQHFISESTWDEEGIITRLQADAAKLFGDPKRASLHIDGSAFGKQGRNSVGVARQYNGRLGKVDNCQVGVFLGYAKKGYRALIDKRLYLPKEWIDDKERRKKCKVPDEVVFKTKAELGLEMIQRAKERKLPFGWVGMDAEFGEQPWLLDALDKEGITYIADIASNTRAWLKKPKTELPPKMGITGRKPTIVRIPGGEPKPLEVRKIAKDPSMKWETIFIRDTERKPLWTQIACLRVYPVKDKLPGEPVWLIIRQNEGEKETKYQLSNADEHTSTDMLGKMSASRYWIERALQDAKSDMGMADYQLRGWRGWHHHITMTFMAMLFLTDMLIELHHKIPLTIQDVREIFEYALSRQLTEDEFTNWINQKIKARQSARRSHHTHHKRPPPK